MLEAVITGIGVVTPAGCTAEAMWQSLLKGKSCLREIPYFDASKYRNPRGGVVSDVIPPAGRHRVTAYTVEAARQAIGQAGIDVSAPHTAMICASNFGPPVPTEDFESFSRDAARQLGVGGAVFTISLSCASGAAAAAWGAQMVCSGAVDAAIVVGCEEISETWYSGLCALRAVTPDTIRPFDRDRSGTLFGEGAGAIVIQRREDAPEERVLAVLAGWYVNNDAYHMTAPHPEGAGLRAAMERALEAAGVPAEKVDYVNAHGTGTVYNDPLETKVIKEVLGERAFEVPVVSIKPVVSHMMGAAGIVETVACILSLRHQTVPPTANLEHPDPACDLDYVIDRPRQVKLGCAVNLSSGIGGSSCALVLKRP